MADEYNEQLRPGGLPAEAQLDIARRDQELIRDVIKGARPPELQEKYGLSYRQVRRVISDAARAVRDQTADIAAEAFMLQKERLERLYALVEKQLQLFEDGEEGFDDRPFRVAVAIFDRQAKLLGLDRGSVRAAANGNWLDDAPIEQVVDYAKSLRMNVPSQFET